jgi:signal transduction histidine kinase
MSTSEGAGAQHRQDSATRQWSIPTKVTLAVVPLAVVSLLIGIFLVWNLVTTDTTDGFSTSDVWAIVVGSVVGLVVAGSVVTVYLISRSMRRAIMEVSTAARTVADRDLIDLLDALRTPDADLSRISPPRLDTDRGDELGELARSFGDLHASLVDVAARQMEALRAGVSSIFVTLARRNSSLVDRQLAMLDELEAREEDAEILGGYYQLDHLATRMRRNAESLLVLAGSESPRVWGKATDMTDVIRAAVGEVDEYQRIEVVALEPAKLSGGAVSDIAHLLAELLENAIQFSPPSEAVRVTGLFDIDGYTVTVSDRGVGISEARLAELNRIIDKPPALGLSVEPTMGMYVVAKLAHRHGVAVELIRGLPGVTARVVIPRDHLETVNEPEPRYWESDYAEKVLANRGPSSPDPSQFGDEESREYVARRVAAAAGDDGVVDLTAPEFEDKDADTAPPGPLPVRTPGAAFNEDEVDMPATGPGDGGQGIRSALAAYDRGRRAAEEGGDVGEESDLAGEGAN